MLELKLLLFRLQREILVRLRSDRALGGDKEPAGAGSRILDDVAGHRLHQSDEDADQHARREILSGAALGLFCVLLEQPLVEISEAISLLGKPMQLVDRGD